MKNLNSTSFQKAISLVNQQGFASIDLSEDLSENLGERLYARMDKELLHPQREKYYNEIAFYWPEDWTDVKDGICSFHEQKSLKHIRTHVEGLKILTETLGESLAQEVLSFVSTIKELTIANHVGLKNNELRLARVMLRQMSENDHTLHTGSDWHEDQGYADRPYQQLLSVIITTHGQPTEAVKHKAKVGELLIFNARDRRLLLGMDDDFTFLHKGPKSGPKMFFFFEFLGPRES